MVWFGIMKVLIVEDEALIALAYADVMESMGYTVVGICASLPEAQELTRSAAPDIALVDLRLGNRRCGARVDAWLHDTFGTTAVYITANPEFAVTYRARAIGFAEKPLSADSLMAVTRYLAAHHAGCAPATAPHGLHLFEDRVSVASEPAETDRARARE